MTRHVSWAKERTRRRRTVAKAIAAGEVSASAEVQAMAADETLSLDAWCRAWHELKGRDAADQRRGHETRRKEAGTMSGTKSRGPVTADAVARVQQAAGGRPATGSGSRRASPTITAAETVQRRAYVAACKTGEHNAEIARRIGGTMTAESVGVMKGFVGADPDANMEAFAAALQNPAPGSVAYNRDEFLDRAVAAGTITAAELPTYRRAFLNDRPTWDAMEARHAAGQRSASTTSPVAASTPAAATGLQRSADTGELTWRGMPVRLTPGGVPAVATASGWVATTAAAGMSDEDLRAPYDIASASPTGSVAQMLAEGPR